MVTLRKKLGDTFSIIVPCARHRKRMAAGNDFELGKRWIAGKIFVRIYIHALRMIDGQQTRLIEIDHLFQRLHEAKAQKAVALPNLLTVYLYIFVRIGNVAFAGTDPVAHYSGADHIGNKPVARAVPDKEHRTGAATA